jgi:hypothetical protein
MLNVIALSVAIYLLLCCHYTECHYAECHYAECHYAECHYAECRGTLTYIIVIYYILIVLKNGIFSSFKML